MPSIAAISIYVENLEKAVEFYTHALGFSVRSRPAPVIVELDQDSPALVLCQAERRSAYDYPASSGTVIGIASTDVAERAKAMRAKGIKLVIDVPQPFPGGRYIAVQDPSGNVIELLEFEGAQ
jgi:catechol 2,3-dioxygenase-like lactoylglutathione lyase family enzyme